MEQFQFSLARGTEQKANDEINSKTALAIYNTCVIKGSESQKWCSLEFAVRL